VSTPHLLTPGSCSARRFFFSGGHECWVFGVGLYLAAIIAP